MSNNGYFFSLENGASISLGRHHFELSAVQTSSLAFGTVAAYICLVIWASRTSWWHPTMRSWKKFHYAALFLYSAFAMACALYHVLQSGELQEFTLWALGSQAVAQPRLLCTPVPAWLRAVSLTFTLSKVWEWVDTLELFSKGKSVGSIGILHLYHHATTTLLFLIVSSFPVTEKAGMLLNGGVHTIMYYHFAFRLPKVLRPAITVMQIIQLAVVTCAWPLAASVCPECSVYFNANPLSFHIIWLTAPMYFVLFVKFYVDSYCSNSKAEVKDGERWQLSSEHKVL